MNVTYRVGRHSRNLALVLLVAACGTPQENCIRRNTQDLRVVNELVAETEGNIRRGYAIERTEITRQRWETCERTIYRKPPKNPDGTRPPPVPELEQRMCLEDYTDTITRNVAIDLGAERRKLASLRDKQAQLNRFAASAVEQCRAAYPE